MEADALETIPQAPPPEAPVDGAVALDTSPAATAPPLDVIPDAFADPDAWPDWARGLEPEPQRAPIDRRRPWGPWASLGWGALGFGVVFVSGIVVTISLMISLALRGELGGGPVAIQAAFEAEMHRLVFGSTTLEFMLIAPYLTLLARLRGFRAMEYLGNRRITGRALLAALLYFAAAIGAMLLLSMATPEDDSGMVFMRSLMPTWDAVPYMAFVVVLVGPATEEALVRGFMYRGIEARWGAWPAILIPGAMWTLTHVQYDWPNLLSVFTMGLALGTIRWRTGSLLLAIVGHVAFNAIAMWSAVYQIFGMQ